MSARQFIDIMTKDQITRAEALLGKARTKIRTRYITAPILDKPQQRFILELNNLVNELLEIIHLTQPQDGKAKNSNKQTTID